MNKKHGFTLLELVVVIVLLAMLVTAGLGLFFRSLRTTGKIDANLEVERNAELVLGVMERFIKNAKLVESVSGQDCPANGYDLTLVGADGLPTTFGLDAGGRIASNGAAISSDKVEIRNLEFECIRIEGVPDRVRVAFEAIGVDTSAGAETILGYELIVGLRNY